MFELARALHKTRAELLRGHPVPLSANEYAGWVALYTVEAAEREAARRKK